MYIKSINIHFTMTPDVLEVKGTEAQRLHDRRGLEEELITVEVENGHRLIPRSSILFIDVIEHIEANQLNKVMKKTFNSICVLANIEDEDWGYWIIQDHNLCVKFYEDEEPYFLSNKPQVVELAKKLFEMDDQLRRLLAGDDHE